jgi:5-methylcytosine-specific restriction endonuclease McrA
MTAPLRQRPILGGVFGEGRYALGSMPCVAKGLHSVRYLVIEPASGVVVSIADAKVDALDRARAVLAAAEHLAQQRADADTRVMRQGELWPREDATPAPPPCKRRPVSRRRREIFEKSAGRCHYCATTLTLDGSWHVEHMLPRALGGEDKIGNLVAACAPCNLSKGDRTALEFVAGRVSASPD